jgi:hypothetical protein
MSNGNDKFTKVYRGTPNAFDFLQVGTLDANTTNSTIINGEQYVTVTGYAPTQFATLTGLVANATAGNVISTNLLFLTSPNQTAATTITDSRLLKIPANSVVKSIVLSNRGGASGSTPTSIATASNTFSISMFPVAATNLPTTPLALAAGAGLLLPTSSGTNINDGLVANFNTAAGVPVGTGVGLPLTVAGIGATAAGFLTTDAFVGVYGTTATTNTAGALKIQITYRTYNL